MTFPQRSGDTAIVIELFTRGGIDDRDLEPIDRHSIRTTAQAHVVDVAHHRHFREAPIPVVPFMCGHRVVGLPKRQASSVLHVLIRTFNCLIWLSKAHYQQHFWNATLWGIGPLGED